MALKKTHFLNQLWAIRSYMKTNTKARLWLFHISVFRLLCVSLWIEVGRAQLAKRRWYMFTCDENCGYLSGHCQSCDETTNTKSWWNALAEFLTVTFGLQGRFLSCLSFTANQIYLRVKIKSPEHVKHKQQHIVRSSCANPINVLCSSFPPDLADQSKLNLDSKCADALEPACSGIQELRSSIRQSCFNR